MKLKLFISILLCCLLVTFVSAADWTPYGYDDINLVDSFNITNVPYYNGTRINITSLWVDGTQITGIETDLIWTTNRTNMRASNCSGSVVIGIYANGTFACETDDASAGGTTKKGDGIYLYNDSDTLYLNETKLNVTISDLATSIGDTNASNCGDGEYLDGSGLCINFNSTVEALDSFNNVTAGSNITVSGNVVSLNVTGLLEWLGNVYQAVGSYLTSAVTNILSSDGSIEINQSTGSVDVTVNMTFVNATIDDRATGTSDGTGGWTNDSLTTNTTLDVHIDGNINFTELIYGNGSQLTGITTTETDSLAYNGTLAYNTSLAVYDALNATGLIKNWNESGWIADWNSLGYIKDWNSTGYIKDWSGDFATNTKVDSLGNWSADKGDYALDSKVDSIGNWSADQSGYTTTGYVDSLGNFTAWDNITGIPTATPSDGDTTHFSLADEIYDWVIGLSYSTTSYVDGLIASLGNWSADKSSYSTTGYADSLGNFSEWSNVSETALNWDGLDTPADINAADITDDGTYLTSYNNLTEDNVEDYIFDDDNTADLNMSSYNVVGVNCINFTNGATWCTA